MVTVTSFGRGNEKDQKPQPIGRGAVLCDHRQVDSFKNRTLSSAMVPVMTDPSTYAGQGVRYQDQKRKARRTFTVTERIESPLSTSVSKEP